MTAVVIKTGHQPSSANEVSERKKAGMREIVYDVEEFKKKAKTDIHYEIVRETVVTSPKYGLTKIKLYCNLTSLGEGGHIVKYERTYFVDPYGGIDDLNAEIKKIADEFIALATRMGATPGRWW